MEDKTDKQQQFIELRAKGNSFDNIVKKLKVSKGTLISWSKNFDLGILIDSYLTGRLRQLV